MELYERERLRIEKEEKDVFVKKNDNKHFFSSLQE